MTLTAYITPKELERQALAVFAGKNCKVWGVYDPLGNLTMETAGAVWLAARVTDLIEATIGNGTYNIVRERYELPPVVARFEPDAGGLDYTTICVWVDEAPFLHSIQIEDPPLSIPEGQYRSYLIYFAQDDGPNVLLPIQGLFQPGAFYLWGGESSWTKGFPEDSSVSGPGVFVLEGNRAELKKTLPPGTNKAVAGEFVITGQEIGYTYVQKATSGRFELNGNATLFVNSIVTPASILLTGGEATLSQYV